MSSIRQNKFHWMVSVITIALVIAASSVAMYSSTGLEKGMDESRGKGIISLILPSFIGVAGATEAMDGTGSAFPVDEAGITAYIDTGQTIALEDIMTVLSVVEDVGDNYIIGIITPISNFGGDINDIHLYVDTDGWLVAYFTNDTPASKIMQWYPADVNTPTITIITNTTLSDALYKAGDAAGIDIDASEIKYYHFEYPDANGMTLFVKTRATDGTNFLQVKIPETYILYEASYYHYIRSSGRYTGEYHYWDSKLMVDGTMVSDPYTNYYTVWCRAFNTYGASITPGTLHTIEISYEAINNPFDYGSAGAASVLIYKAA